MSHKTFHAHGAAEVRVTVLQRAGDPDEIKEANPRKPGEKDEDYAARLEALHAATAKRVDFHIFESEEFLPGVMQQLFDSTDEAARRQFPQQKDEKDEDYQVRISRIAAAYRYELIYRNGKLIKTLDEVARENPRGDKEEEKDYKKRIQALFDQQ
jgi:hypothetical protein